MYKLQARLDRPERANGCRWSYWGLWVLRPVMFSWDDQQHQWLLGQLHYLPL
jgi:hypothetical protein